MPDEATNRQSESQLTIRVSSAPSRDRPAPVHAHDILHLYLVVWIRPSLGPRVVLEEVWYANRGTLQLEGLPLVVGGKHLGEEVRHRIVLDGHAGSR